MTVDIGTWASFGAGILSFLSPCILPLVPPYLCFLAGTTLDDLTSKSGTVSTSRVLIRAAAFTLGFSCVFVALGASASTLGQLVSEHLTLLSQVAGAVIVLLGLHMLGVSRLMFLMRQAKLEPTSKPVGAIGAFVVGLAFGFGWTPCVGPVLASILLLATTTDSVGRGVVLLMAYSAGIAVPFLAAALFTGRFLRLAARLRRHLALVERIMGGALVVTGVLIFAGAMPIIGAWLQEYVPIVGRIG
jgi:cytochrome c-type biogenesis protein